MANKKRLTFMKKQKERTRKEKAAEKMARRQGRIERRIGEEPQDTDRANELISSGLHLVHLD
jgi:hypothetical protein